MILCPSTAEAGAAPAPRPRSHVARRVGRDLAVHVVAEAFRIAIEDLDHYDDARGSERAWLFDIATNLVRRHWRTETGRLAAMGRYGATQVPAGDPLLCDFGNQPRPIRTKGPSTMNEIKIPDWNEGGVIVMASLGRRRADPALHWVRTPSVQRPDSLLHRTAFYRISRNLVGVARYLVLGLIT